jgi:hypothetical protein
VCAIRKCAQFLHEGAVPRFLYDFDVALLALRNERIGAVLLVAFFPFGRNLIALQQASKVTRLELTGAPRVLRNADSARLADGRGGDLLLAPAELLNFLKEIDAQVPEGLDIHIVIDNYATHKTPKIKA